jgi:hypothetical protein
MNTFRNLATRIPRRSPVVTAPVISRPDRGGAGDERLDGRDLPGGPPRLQLISFIPSPPKSPRALGAATDREFTVRSKKASQVKESQFAKCCPTCPQSWRADLRTAGL